MNLAAASNNKGFTLVEIMVALAIAVFFLGVVSAHFLSQQSSYQAQDQVVEMQQSLRGGITLMTQDLRMAGYDPYNTKTVGITTADEKKVTFTYVADDDGKNNDKDGETDEAGELETVTFDHYQPSYSSMKALGREIGGAKAAIAENIEKLEFRYLNAKDEVETNLEDIRTIKISILARVGKKDKKFKNSKIYIPEGHDSTNPWGPYDDEYRRRFQIVTVNLRNLEI